MDETAFRAARLLDALRNPLRYRIVKLLSNRPQTPADLAATLERPLPTISQHLSLLRKVDVVWYETRSGRPRYSLKHPQVLELLRYAERCVGDMQIRI